MRINEGKKITKERETKQIILKTALEGVHMLDWLQQVQKDGFIKRIIGDIYGTWYPFSFSRMLFEAVIRGEFFVEIKRDCWLGKTGEVVNILFSGF